MVGSVPLQSEQVALPQTHGPGAVPDCPLVSGENQVFDLQLTILSITAKANIEKWLK